jgi:hypothetical protein
VDWLLTVPALTSDCRLRTNEKFQALFLQGYVPVKGGRPLPDLAERYFRKSGRDHQKGVRSNFSISADAGHPARNAKISASRPTGQDSLCELQSDNNTQRGDNCCQQEFERIMAADLAFRRTSGPEGKYFKFHAMHMLEMSF